MRVDYWKHVCVVLVFSMGIFVLENNTKPQHKINKSERHLQAGEGINMIVKNIKSIKVHSGSSSSSSSWELIFYVKLIDDHVTSGHLIGKSHRLTAKSDQ